MNIDENVVDYYILYDIPRYPKSKRARGNVITPRLSATLDKCKISGLIYICSTVLSELCFTMYNT
jgi:hypothetical protein